jgi:Flp pilus assembly protein TadG
VIVSKGERGSAAIEFALGFLVLLLPVAILVLSFGPTLERRVLARTLSTESARAIAHSGGVSPVGLEANLASMIRASGVSDDSVRIDVCGVPLLNFGQTIVCDQSSVEVRVVVDVGEQWLPGGPESVSAIHVEPMSPYRSRP